MKYKWLPKEERNTMLFLSDDMRIPSGIGTMTREIIEGTCHRYNWVQLGSAIDHPEHGKILDISEDSIHLAAYTAPMPKETWNKLEHMLDALQDRPHYY